MANRDFETAARAEPASVQAKPQAAGPSGADGLRDLLAHITEQIVEADRRHTEVLHQMQERLAVLAEEAKVVRDRAPEHADTFDRIEGGMAALSERVAEVSERRAPEPEPMALKSAAGPQPARAEAAQSAHVDRFDILDASRPGDAADPWDQQAAEALMGLHESGETGFAVALAAPETAPRVEAVLTQAPLASAPVETAHEQAMSPAAAVEPAIELAPESEPAPAPAQAFALSLPDVDKAWLADQISALARQLEQSLAELNPQTTAQELGARFTEFEERLAVALDVVATRSDVEALGLIEAHIGELAGHLDSTQAHLARLDNIEAHLQSVVEQLSDERLAQAMPAAAPASYAADLEHLASEAARQAAARVQSFVQQAPPGGDTSELRSMLSRIMDERRAGEEQTLSMLDTMQQALIRVLDRMDAMEMAQHRAAPSYAHAEPRMQAAVVEPLRAGAPLGRDMTPAAQPEPAVARAAPAAAAAPVLSVERQPELQAHPVPAAAASGIDRVRQDLKAEAQRAKQRAETEAAQAAAKPDAKAGPSKKNTAAKADAGAGKSSLLTGKNALYATVVLGLVLVGGTMFLKKKRPMQAAPVTIEQSIAPEGVEAPAASAEAVTEPAMEGAPADAGQSPAVKNLKSKQRATIRAMPDVSEQPDDAMPPPPGSETGSDDLSLGDRLPVTQSSAKAAAARTGKVLLPLGMMSLQSPTSAPITPDLFKIAGSTESATPAALSTDVAPAPAGSQRQSALDLPPLTVGPLSLRLAAAKGDPSAEFEVGARLAEGKGTGQNFKEAMRWYHRSATRGFAQAQYRLGTLYERGLGAPADMGRARIWYQRAAEQGNVKAMHNLAVLAAGRETGTPDYPAAARWFRDAAERNLADSQFNIGVLYESGLGVEKDLKQAYKWFTLAAAGGDKEAVRRRDGMKPLLAPADLSEAETLAKAFSPVRNDPIVNDARAAGEDWKKRQANDGNG